MPFLQSYTDAPMDLPELVLCQEKKPNYLNPFKKVEFSYQAEINETYGECNIIERAESIFTSKMEAISGDPYEYWNGYEEDGFARPQVGYTYANLFFFLVQYLIAGSFIFVLLKPEKKLKKLFKRLK